MISNLKLKKKLSLLGVAYISAFLDAKFLFLGTVMTASQIVRNSSLWCSLELCDEGSVEMNKWVAGLKVGWEVALSYNSTGREDWEKL